MTDTSLLQDFITESVEHLEDMETKLLQLESDPGNSEILNDIFRSIHTIKGASEYMGMERISELAHKLENLLDMLRKDTTITLTDYMLDTLMTARDRIVLLIGDLELTQSEETTIDDVLTAIKKIIDNPDETGLDGASSESSEEASEIFYDSEIMEDFVSEARDYLEEMDANLSLLNDDPENKEAFNELFRAIHTIKGAADYMGIERIAALSKQLESFLLKIRQEELTLDIKTIQLIAAVPKRIAILIGELEQTLTEKTEIDDLSDALQRVNEQSQDADFATDEMMVAEDDYTDEEAPVEQDDELFDDEYDEEYDEELFDIFLEQLQESIFSLHKITNEMPGSGNQVAPVLEKYIDCIQGLYSSANYMGYEKLANYYEKWTGELHAVLEAGHPGEGLSWQDYIETQINFRINKIMKLFPQLKAFSGEADTMEEDITSVDEEPTDIFENDSVFSEEADEITDQAEPLDRDASVGPIDDDESVLGEEANLFATSDDEFDLDEEGLKIAEITDEMDSDVVTDEITESTDEYNLDLEADAIAAEADEKITLSTDEFDMELDDDDIAESADELDSELDDVVADIPDELDLYQDDEDIAASADELDSELDDVVADIPDELDLYHEDEDIIETAGDIDLDSEDEEVVEVDDEFDLDMENDEIAEVADEFDLDIQDDENQQSEDISVLGDEANEIVSSAIESVLDDEFDTDEDAKISDKTSLDEDAIATANKEGAKEPDKAEIGEEIDDITITEDKVFFKDQAKIKFSENILFADEDVASIQEKDERIDDTASSFEDEGEIKDAHGDDGIEEEYDESEYQVDEIEEDETEAYEYTDDDELPLPTSDNFSIVSSKVSYTPYRQETPVIEKETTLVPDKTALYNKLETAFDLFMSHSLNLDSDAMLADTVEALFSKDTHQPQATTSPDFGLALNDSEPLGETPQYDPRSTLFSQKEMVQPDLESQITPSLKRDQAPQSKVQGRRQGTVPPAPPAAKIRKIVPEPEKKSPAPALPSYEQANLAQPPLPPPLQDTPKKEALRKSKLDKNKKRVAAQRAKLSPPKQKAAPDERIKVKNEQKKAKQYEKDRPASKKLKHRKPKKTSVKPVESSPPKQKVALDKKIKVKSEQKTTKRPAFKKPKNKGASASGRSQAIQKKAPASGQETAQKVDSTVEAITKKSIRVDAKKIDDLINQVGELVVSRAWFSQLYNEMRTFQQYLKEKVKLDQKNMKQVRGITFRLSEATVALGRVANELQEGVMRVRMLPIAQLFNRYPRLVRDLTHNADKKVRLEVKGEDTELDKMIIEEISDPLIHIIRNAVDHGIETVPERRQANKSEAGRLILEAYHESNHVVIEISDDGCGIDPDKIKATALKRKLLGSDELDLMADKELIGLITIPGFSTAAQVTTTSGRGVGMDVVKKNIEKLNGTLEIDSKVGAYTRFRIKIPLTLAIIPALLVKVGIELYTIPLAAVEETLRIYSKDTTTIEGTEVIHIRNMTLPLVRLSEIFGIPSDADSGNKEFVVIVSTGLKKIGLVVDALIGQEEVVIKPLEDYLQEKSGFSGATILGDGRISLILDVYELANLSIERLITKRKVQM